IFPDEDDFGRIFRNNAVMSAAGVPQFAAIMGNCVAGGGYLPVMCDTLLMTEGSGLYLAGPALVKAAIGQEVSSEELGGAQMHASISGTIDYREVNDALCIERLRRLIDKLGKPPHTPFCRTTSQPPARPAERIYDPVAAAKRGEYDVRDLLAHLLDRDSFDEYRPEYGQTVVCGFGRLDGWPVGIVANQKKLVRPARGPVQFPSVIYVDSADKMARFILDCNQMKAPLVFVQDVSGFMVGRDSEQEGIIRSGAKVVNAVSNSVVPKITLITGGSYGAGNYAMCGKAYDPRFIFAWPTAKYAVMSGASAAKTLLELEIAKLRKKGHEPDRAELEQLEKQITDAYNEQMDIRYAAARGWVDAIVPPAETRRTLALALEACAYIGDLPELRTGVFQV
ncbi:MAG: acyl-CoA carboxylase subunit beta, partial [Planctomycetota bacterium]